MWRYVRLYAHFIRFSFSRAMEFRFDFFFRFGMDALWYGVIFSFFKVLFVHTNSIGGWSESEVLLMTGTMFISDAVFMTIFASNLWMFPVLINKGDLDYYLVRPVSSLFFLSVREFAVNSLLNVLLAVGAAIAIFSAHAEAWTVARLPIYAALIVLGVVIDYLLHLIFVIPVFWLHNGSGLRELSQSLSSFSGRPDSIYTGAVRRVITTIIPFALVTSFPTRSLFAVDPWPIVLHMCLATAGVLAATVWLWRRGLRAYSSASS